TSNRSRTVPLEPRPSVLDSGLVAFFDMRILTRYILREVASHALIGATVFTFVMFSRDLASILELVVRNSAPVPSVAEIFFFTVPVALTYTDRKSTRLNS